MPIRAVLFDMDGTLLESDEALVQAFSYTLRKFGFPTPTPEQVLAHSGHTGAQWLRALLPKHSHRLVPEMGPYLARTYAARFLPRLGEPMPGAHATLLALRASGVRTGVISNMERWVLDSVLRRLELEGLFDAVVSGEETPSPKPSGVPLRVALGQLGLDADSALYVGDTEVDVRAGRHAGVRVVLLDHPRNRGVKGAWRRIDGLEDLLALAAGEGAGRR